MKKLIIASFILLSSYFSLSSQKFVGHRGSLYGVENTQESFRKGAELGYDYLETDIRVTKDSVFVCSHDENTERLGGNLVIAEATLDQLKDENLSQTRGGVEYTGKICTMQEYLDICKDNDTKPLIELKWGTGINNDDFGNIPALIQLIEDNGFRNDCIILTSMKKCLDYIRETYPDVTAQFLTAQYWPNHFDWCVEQGLDVDIQHSYVDEETVKKFHEKGLKVNVWTVNDPQRMKELIEMGCDFITTDKLTADCE